MSSVTGAVATPIALDDHTFGYRWNFEHVRKTDTKNGTLATLPEYFQLAWKLGC